jgi:hypothetical protein
MALLPQLLEDFNENLKKYSVYTEVFINGIDFALIVEFCVVSLETALNTQTVLTIRTPKECLLPLVLVTHNTPLCWP